MNFDKAAAAIRAERDLWNRLGDARLDAQILDKMHQRDPVAATEAEVEEAKKKEGDLLTAWSESRCMAKAALDEVLASYDLKRTDLSGLVSY